MKAHSEKPLPGATTPGGARRRRLPYGLEEFDDTGEAARVISLEERARADTEIVDRLMWAGYQGEDWDEFVGIVVAYGLRVITAWIVDGRIVPKCRAKGHAAGWDARCRDRDVARDLATGTLVIAVERFHERSPGGRGRRGSRRR